MTVEAFLFILGVIAIGSPAMLLAVLGGSMLMGYYLSEVRLNRLMQVSVVSGLLASIAVLVTMLLTGSRHVEIVLGNWIVIPQQHFHFTLSFVFDRLSVPFTILSFVLCGVVGVFTSRYLHREPGYTRYFLFYATFLLGMVTSSLAGTVETLFAGWELVGLSSTLLVAFFHERTSPVRNGLHVWSIYRIADAAFLVAAVMLHHLSGEGDFSTLAGTGAWPDGQAAITPTQAFFVGMLLLIAAAGKSALLPFSGWLPRAMEGPTSSSAIFYGALSVHLGAYLLLRASPILELSPALSVIVVVLGLSTALYGAMASSVQPDIKNALALASLTQVGLIVAEIGCGLRYIPLIHILGHATLRTLQLLRAPSILHDYRQLENAIGTRISNSSQANITWLPQSVKNWWYRFSLDRGYLDIALVAWIVSPLLAVLSWISSCEERWIKFLAGDREITTTSDEGVI